MKQRTSYLMVIVLLLCTMIFYLTSVSHDGNTANPQESVQSKINIMNPPSPLVPAKGDYNPIDGTGTDDTANIQAIINSVSSGVVIIPYAKYKLTTTLIIPKNVILEGIEYPSLYFTGVPDSTKTAIRLDGDHAVCQGLCINVVSGDYRKTLGHRANYVKSVNNRISVTTPDNPIGEDDFVLFASMLPTILNGVEMVGNDITAHGIKQADGIQISGCPGVKVTGNHIHDFSVGTPDKQNWGIYVSQLSPNALVQDNIIENMPTGGIHFNSTSGNPDKNKQATNNTIRNCQWNGLSIGFCIDPIVTGNVIDNVSQHIFVSNTTGGIISGNTFSTGNSTIMDSGRPMVSIAGGVGAMSIIHNIFGNAGECITGVIVASSNITITDNEFTLGGPGTAVSLADTSRECVVKDNRIESNN